MGLQVRKRTKGKDGWLNGSYSKRGPRASASVKAASNVTYNTGNLLGGKGHPSRLTVNLGNGVRWVSYGKKSKSNPSQASGGSFIMALGIIILFVIFLIGAFLA